MRGDKFKYNKAILYSTIINTAHLYEYKEYKGCTIKDIFQLIPSGNCSIEAIRRALEIFIAKGIISESHYNEDQNNAKTFKLSNLGKMLLSKCNSEMVLIYDSINTNKP